jgi:hypothetical protein
VVRRPIDQRWVYAVTYLSTGLPYGHDQHGAYEVNHTILVKGSRRASVLTEPKRRFKKATKVIMTYAGIAGDM